MRALEAFHEAEQIRLALRQTLTVQRQVQDADNAAGVLPTRRSTATPPSRSLSIEPEDENGTTVFEETLAKVETPGLEKAVHVGENQGLMMRLPDSIVLDEIIGSFLDFDTIFLLLPQLSKDWQKVIWGAGAGALLWKKLCQRAWIPLQLPMRSAVVQQGNQWQLRFMRRPTLRLSGPYVTYTVFIQYPGPRNMWTPKDAPSIKVVYHYRFWWFREGNELLYIALATRTPGKIIEMMRKELLVPGSGSPGPDIVFWRGTYELTRTETGLICDVDVPHERHGVKFRFELCPGGGAVKVLRHQSYRFKTPSDLMFHPLPEHEDDRLFKYRAGFL